MGFVVKNTTKCGVLDLLCPHTCRGCGQLGAVLCERCKKYMLEQRKLICPICKQEFAELAKSGGNMGKGKQRSLWKCPECEMPFMGLWVLGWRVGILKKIVEEYKYQSVRAMGAEIVKLFDEIIPSDFGNGEKVVVVPLPTIGRHVRERGLDHTMWVARKLAKKRGWKCERILARAVDTVQVGTKAGEREEQAREAYMVVGEVEEGCNYLLLDDVWTTGATMTSAARLMQEAGVKNLYATVLAVSKPKDE